jgi:Threonine dehydratase
LRRDRRQDTVQAMKANELPTAADVEDAARVLKDVAIRTPLIASAALDRLTGGRVFLKAEIFQRTGSFKFRGASFKFRGAYKSSAAPTIASRASRRMSGLRASSPIRRAITRKAWQRRPSFWACRRRSSCPPTCPR